MLSPQLGSPLMTSDPYRNDFPSIAPPNVPIRMPGDGFDSPAQPRPADVERNSSPIHENLKLSLGSDSRRAQVIVKLPAEAKLSVEGRPLTVTNGERTFVTPPLPADRDAIYSFKVEYTRDGETLARTRKVKVRAGETIVVEFTDLFATGRNTVAPGRAATTPPELRPTVPQPTTPFNAKTTAATEAPTVKSPFPADQAKIVVKLPPGATLYVNGAKNDRTETVRDFVTPTLTPGKVYEYTMKAEVVRNGLPEFQEQTVEFRGGDMLTIDFTNLGTKSTQQARR
jgi:uncharacterized protein (TIGR03000 family)